MPLDERQTWNLRYRDPARGARAPEPFLVHAYETFVAPLFPRGGTALDVAGGTGRHALYLAAHGWHTTLTDISEVGIERARAEAVRRGLALECICDDARKIDFGRERFDLVVGFFYLEREIMPRLAAALRRGGIVVYKTFTEQDEKFATHGIETPSYFLKAGELPKLFPGFHILHYQEFAEKRVVAELVARKPDVEAASLGPAGQSPEPAA
jgi:tellurite methyltransferase